MKSLDWFDAAIKREKDARRAKGMSVVLDSDTIRLLAQAAQRVAADAAVCIRCGHTRDQHEHKGVIEPCNRYDIVLGQRINCICYTFITSPLVLWLRELHQHGTPQRTDDRATSEALAWTITQDIIRRRLA